MWTDGTKADAVIMCCTDCPDVLINLISGFLSADWANLTNISPEKII
jgi:hypothetical protein